MMLNKRNKVRLPNGNDCMWMEIEIITCELEEKLKDLNMLKSEAAYNFQTRVLKELEQKLQV